MYVCMYVCMYIYIYIYIHISRPQELDRAADRVLLGLALVRPGLVLARCGQGYRTIPYHTVPYHTVA